MKKYVTILVVTLAICLTTTAVLARNIQSPRDEEKNSFKNMLKSYLMPGAHGYGIGFNGDQYITAKWYLVNVRTLSVGEIKHIVSDSNASTWSEIKDEVQNALSNATKVTQGRINIGKTNYALTSIIASNSSFTADIRTIPDYNTCKQQNMSAMQCENNSTKVGDISVTEKRNAITDSKENTRVWTGTLNFNSVAYTFVSFAFPRSVQ
jgi:hypothetical protein